MLRSHGITNDPEKMTEDSHGPWYYQQIALGFNYRMTDVEAALGLSQLSKLETFLEKRNVLANYYDKLFSDYSGITPLQQNSKIYSSYHLYVVRIDSLTNQQHATLVANLRESGVFAHVHYIPIHMQPFYISLGFKIGDFPNAEKYYQQAVTLPLFPDLKEDEVEHIVALFVDIVNKL